MMHSFNFFFVCVCLFLVSAWLHFYCMLTTVKKKSGYWDNKIHIWKIAQPLFWLGCLWGHLFSVVIHLCWVLLLLHYIKSTTSFTFLQWNSTICSGRPEAPEDAFSFPVASSTFSRPCVLVLWAVYVLLTYSNGRQLFLFLVFNLLTARLCWMPTYSQVFQVNLLHLKSWKAQSVCLTKVIAYLLPCIYYFLWYLMEANGRFYMSMCEFLWWQGLLGILAIVQHAESLLKFLLF